MLRAGIMSFIVVAACAYDRDALYEPAAGHALPLLPFKPDLERRDACTACATERCTAQREACLADTECVELLDCRGDCSDPACLSRCGSRAFYDPMGQRPVTLGVFGE